MKLGTWFDVRLSLWTAEHHTRPLSSILVCLSIRIADLGAQHWRLGGPALENVYFNYFPIRQHLVLHQQCCLNHLRCDMEL